ncbi:uncharacterized protein LOC9639355 isoform X2 [Selaginella moellendorffii]|uniref:uncharacterized protein LOC9639355 isoform X2 n=1 Tax=Selaginella moellendorffii TaxID=88036 RepID=UPI000D1C6143|nr:uncharacterized protein LOC9639355 isoform X2 [Selaginella moellendorffii]|eukprot:XP_024538286.1 uncharacterized protein LOC9639355 isoform X2 [Selaginella moellendorffii]
MAISPASLSARRLVSYVRLKQRRSQGARAAHQALKRESIAKGAPGLIGIQEKYSLRDPRLVWYKDENRKPFYRNTKEHGRWRHLAYPQEELEDQVKTEDVHWLTGLGALDRVRVVLVGSQSAGNVGSVCRIASNFECRHVWLVSPECDYFSDEARQMAVNPVAKSLLEDVNVVKTIPEAVGECLMAIGFTRRDGRDRVVNEVPYPKLCIPAKGQAIALVFGREDDGLTNEELLYCTHTCRIPTTKWEGSLNVSHAVALALSKMFSSYERLRRVHKEPGPEYNEFLPPPGTAPLREVDLLLRRWRSVVKNCNVAASLVSKPEFTTRHRLQQHLKRIFHRARLAQREVNIIHGFLTLVDGNAHTVGDLFSDLQEKMSEGESEEDYEEFLKKAEECNKKLEEERGWDEYDYSETDEEEKRAIQAELESY